MSDTNVVIWGMMYKLVILRYKLLELDEKQITPLRAINKINKKKQQ